MVLGSSYVYLDLRCNLLGMGCNVVQKDGRSRYIRTLVWWLHNLNHGQPSWYLLGSSNILHARIELEDIRQLKPIHHLE